MFLRNGSILSYSLGSYLRSVNGARHISGSGGKMAETAEQQPATSQESTANQAAKQEERKPSVEQRELWRASNSPFVKTPQAFVSTLKEKQETRVGIVDLHPDIFRVSPRIDILHQNVVWQQKYRNVILTKQLTRAEMPGGGRKPWPQKRTGRSHAGSIRTHQFIRGGFSKGVRGPTNFFYILPNQKRIMGLCTALTIKLAQNGLQFVDSLNDFPENDPKFLFDMAEERNWGYSVLFINDNDKVGSNLVTCCEEYPWFNIMPIYGLNVFSILKYDTVILSIPALKILEERLLRHMHQTGPINKKFKYIEWKERILNEAEGEDHPKWTPFV